MEPEAILVGEILKAHGIRGEVVVRSLSENPARFARGSRLLVGAGPAGAAAMVVAASRPQPPDKLLVTFEGISDRNRAGDLRGAFVFAPPGDLPPLPEDAFWERDLVGSAVVDAEGRRLGVVSAVLSRAEQDLWEVDAPGGRVLLPAAKGIVVSVDLAQRRVVVDPPAGLFEEPR
jgi:16S rRNA processing protein RimM